MCLDSLAGPFRAEYTGRELLWRRQQLINKILRKLLQYAMMFNLAVVVSNQVVSSPQALFTGDIIAQNPPALGNIVAHGCGTRVYLYKTGERKRVARLFDSAWLPEGQCVFIEDVAV